MCAQQTNAHLLEVQRPAVRGGGVPAAVQGRQDAEAALQAAEEKLAASAAATTQLEEQLAAAAPAAQAPGMSPAGCFAFFISSGRRPHFAHAHCGAAGAIQPSYGPASCQ